MRYTAAPMDDRVVIAWYGDGDLARYEVFDFRRYRPGTNMRLARCAEYYRFIEALKGQGCEVFVWEIGTRGHKRNAFPVGNYRGRKKV